MRFDGVWRICDDGVVRPVIRGELRAADGAWTPVPFLLDVGADRTVFSAAVLRMLGAQVTGATQELDGGAKWHCSRYTIRTFAMP